MSFKSGSCVRRQDKMCSTETQEFLWPALKHWQDQLVRPRWAARQQHLLMAERASKLAVLSSLLLNRSHTQQGRTSRSMDQLASMQQQGPEMPKHQQQIEVTQTYFVKGPLRGGTGRRLVQVCPACFSWPHTGSGRMLPITSVAGPGTGPDCVLGQQCGSSKRWL